MTPAEKKLWYKYFINFQFRVLRQRPINHFIVDLYCPTLKTVIEVDGDSHFTDESQDYDLERNVNRIFNLRISHCWCCKNLQVQT